MVERPSHESATRHRYSVRTTGIWNCTSLPQPCRDTARKGEISNLISDDDGRADPLPAAEQGRQP
jgi:hypothetical protein